MIETAQIAAFYSGLVVVLALATAVAYLTAGLWGLASWVLLLALAGVFLWLTGTAPGRAPT